MDRGIYTVDTVEPHDLRNGDSVIISGSRFPEVNGSQVIENAGVVRPAQGVATVIDGEVVGVEITDPGNFYQRNFYVTFTGGGGGGAYAFATVAPIVDGGGVTAIAMIEGGHNYTHPPTIIFGDETPNTRFTFFTKNVNGKENQTNEFFNETEIANEDLVDIHTESGQAILAVSEENPSTVSYITNALSIRNTVARIEVTSPGVGYESLPTAIGLLKKQSDRAETKITLSGTTIDSVEVTRGGFRYVNPIAVFYDFTGAGSGAAAVVDTLDGIVQSINMTRGGSGYVEPYLELIEADGTYISKTENIGRIKSVKVLNPGRNLTSDKTLTPELDVETRLIISNPQGTLSRGQLVYQGTESYQLASATISNWNPDTQALTVRRISGEIREGETIQSTFGATGVVIQSGQANIDVVVNGSSQPSGRFIDSTSMPSETFAVIQDSYYYQRFSYNIASTMQQVQFQDFVQDIVHPAGFKMFSDFRFTEGVKTQSNPLDVTFESDTDYSAYELLISSESTDENRIYIWTQNNDYITLN
jgi:hypothetical protein